MGWLVIKDIWPLILLGILLGYPLGEYVSGKAYGDYKELLHNLSCREDKAKRMIKKAKEQSSELDRFRYAVQALQKKLYHEGEAAEEQKMRHVALRKKYRSLENELHKARAKMRRLTSSKRIRQKPDEEEPWPE
ncbi:MAG TPA: hypothetical protein ENK89_06535 [Desulfobulbaceae bacterium]|nr:hypothetical protein [Desulfobulbaceae bacterium]